jgi:hypothetical protein
MKLKHAFSGGLRIGLLPMAVGPEQGATRVGRFTSPRGVFFQPRSSRAILWAARKILLLCLFCSVAAADTITWSPPSTYVDGTPLPKSKLSSGYVQVDNCKGKVEMILPYYNTSTMAAIYPAPGVHCWSVAVTTVDGGFNISAPVPHTDACQIGQPCNRKCH